LPSITAPAGHKARAAFQAGFKKYYDKKHNVNASPIIKGRFETLTKAGFNADDLASFDIGIVLASTMNSIPAVFWLLTRIFSSPSLLASLRAEVETIITRSPDGNAAILDVSRLNNECPLLVSSWQETLRLLAATVSARTVTEDTLLADKYFLKKGSFIQLACSPMHTSPLIWGADAQSFSASRFTSPTQTTLSREEKKQRKAGFAPVRNSNMISCGTLRDVHFIKARPLRSLNFISLSCYMTPIR
jgi:cytochrome P450